MENRDTVLSRQRQIFCRDRMPKSGIVPTKSGQLATLDAPQTVKMEDNSLNFAQAHLTLALADSSTPFPVTKFNNHMNNINFNCFPCPFAHYFAFMSFHLSINFGKIKKSNRLIININITVIFFSFNTIFVSSHHMYPENPEGTQVIVGSMNMGYISDTVRNRTHNLLRSKREPIPLSLRDGQFRVFGLSRI